MSVCEYWLLFSWFQYVDLFLSRMIQENIQARAHRIDGVELCSCLSGTSPTLDIF